jgi:hypothetical protein
MTTTTYTADETTVLIMSNGGKLYEAIDNKDEAGFFSSLSIWGR